METLAAYSKNESWLTWFLKGILLLGFVVLVARLIELQVIKGKYYRLLSEGNRIRKIRLFAPRGKVFARGGEILVGNKEVRKKLVFNNDGSIDKVDPKDQNPDDVVISEWVRDYSLGERFFHVGGYVAEADKTEVGKINPFCPEKGSVKLGSYLGRAGLEKEYECLLSGIDGEELIEVDTQGRKVRVLGRKDPVSGKDIKTSIHFGLQEKSSEFLGDKNGALVVSDSKGQILSLYSYPSFNPNLLGRKEYQKEIDAALHDTNLPFLNRAIGGLYHPGSVFKPLVAIAALGEGKIDKNYTFDDPGVINVNNYSYANWYFTQYGKVEGRIDVVKGIARSTDTFFYKIGELLGPDKIADWAEKMGLGVGTDIDLPGEVKGLIPSPVWKERLKKEKWFLGNTYHLSIGQGDLVITPVELNRMTEVLASKGFLCSLKVLQKEKDDCKEIKLEKENLELVKEGMIKACTSGGTGFTFFDFKPQVACKTGTAETNTDGKTHAWFTLWGPVDFPDIVATVLIEGGGEGSKVAGPVARKIFDYWFNEKK